MAGPPAGDSEPVSSFDDVYADIIFDPDPQSGGEDDDDIRYHARRYTLRTPVLRQGDFGDGITSGPVRVTEASPDRLLAVTYEFARNLRREQRYDFVPFPDPTAWDVMAEPWEAWLWSAGNSVRPLAIGAALFSRGRWAKIGERWSLSWVWLHPLFRRQGHLRRAWPRFKSLYGADFPVVPPWSPAMKSFLTAMGHAGPDPDQGQVAPGST